MHIVIDLMCGDDDTVIAVQPEESAEEKAKREKQRLKALEEIFKRAPQPQVVPVTR